MSRRWDCRIASALSWRSRRRKTELCLLFGRLPTYLDDDVLAEPGQQAFGNDISLIDAQKIR